MNYALYEALRIVVEEGLEARWRRHRINAAAFQAGVRAMGLQLAAQEGHRLPQLTTIAVPAGIDDVKCGRSCCACSISKSRPGLGP